MKLMEKNIYDFKKAKAQKQNQLEIKRKDIHESTQKLNHLIDPVKLLKQSTELAEIAESSMNDYKSVTNAYKDLSNHYTDLGNKFGEVVSSIKEKNEQLSMQNCISRLAEHFIVKNGLEDEYIQYLKEISENETDEDYRKAAEWSSEEHEHMILDEYGWFKEEEEKLEKGIK
jgi:hypothetical protein